MKKLIFTSLFSLLILSTPAQLPEKASDSVRINKQEQQKEKHNEPEHQKGMLLYFLIAVVAVGGIVMYIESKKKRD